MIISLNWLADHLDLAGLGVEEISRLLTFAGVEVERIEQKGVASDRIVVAQILSFVQHPDADRLTVCRVEGGQGQPLQIVCGAKNFQAGDKVPLALEGAVLPGDFTIKKGRLRGMESQGMMCSSKELGLGTDHEGLLILPADAPVGTPLGAYLGSDTLMEIEVTPNRPDLLSHYGLARELSALCGVAARGVGFQPTREHRGVSFEPTREETGRLEGDPTGDTTGTGRLEGDPTTVELRSPACPYYTARIIRGIKVTDSPPWLRQKLEAIGLRPINVVVDITNYVLHDLGQPLHAFDLARLEGGIVVRSAAEGEKFLALNGETYALTPDDLVIADQAKPVALAGVMGGAETAVTEHTIEVLLESAYFVPPGLRRTSRRLGLSSDSSYRFERGVDPEMVEAASRRATELIVDLAGGTVQGALVVAGGAPVVTHDVRLGGAHVRRLLGSAISDAEIASILDRLGLRRVVSQAACEETGPRAADFSETRRLEADPTGETGRLEGDPTSALEPTATWLIPSYRQDLQRPVDLIEEVARVAGLEGVPSRTMAQFVAPGAPDGSYDFVFGLKQRLASIGFYEALTMKFVSARQLMDVLGFDRRRIEPLELKNPLSADHTHLRPSLVPGLLAVASSNLRQGAEALRFFEAGTIFATSPNPKTGATESQALALLLSGAHVPSSWLKKTPHAVDLSDLRGVLEAMLARGEVRLKKIEHPSLVLAAEVTLGGKVVGLCGQLTPARARELDARAPVFVAEFNLTALEPLLTRSSRYVEIPRFPAITRDVALEMPSELSHGQIEDFFARQIKEPLLERLQLFDVFSDPSGEKLPVDRKSLAYSLTYRDRTRTLEAREIEAAHARILEALKAKLPVTIR